MTNNSVEWQRYSTIVAWTLLLKKSISFALRTTTSAAFRFADGKVRLGRCFWHLLSMDGLEIAATTMCSTDECPVCEVPKDELDKTDVSYPLLSGSTVKALVEDAQAELLEPDGSVKPRCIGKVGHIVYDIPSYIIYYIIL
jgi:hypothetical protein